MCSIPTARKKLPGQAVFFQRLVLPLKGPEILEESIDQNGSNHQRAHPDKCSVLLQQLYCRGNQEKVIAPVKPAG
jgi:hypothetical protein